jgi:pectate lyase
MNTRRVCVPLALLVAAALACSPSLPSLPSSTALYRDNFSDSSSGWCVDSSPSSSTDYSGGEYVVKVLFPNWFVWCNPGQTFGDIHVEVTAKNVGNTSDTVFGVICNDQKAAELTNEDYYYMGISADGHYTMRLTKGGKDTVLAEDASNGIPTNAISYTVGADCAGGNLALYVDGTQIASAHDSTYTSGDVGVFAWTRDKSLAEIHFDDMVVTKLSNATPTP